MGERDDPQLRRSQSDRAARLMELLGLSEDELCLVLDVDPLTLLSGQLGHRSELPILLDLLDEAQQRAGVGVLRRWARSGPPGRAPVDALVGRDFRSFEDALSELAERGFVLRAGGRDAGAAVREDGAPRRGEGDRARDDDGGARDDDGGARDGG